MMPFKKAFQRLEEEILKNRELGFYLKCKENGIGEITILLSINY